jgi:hypothetical protein
MRRFIALTHYEKGRMRVYLSHDATFWSLAGRRQWVDDDGDGIVHDEGDFVETREEIDALISKAHEAEDRAMEFNDAIHRDIADRRSGRHEEDSMP